MLRLTRREGESVKLIDRYTGKVIATVVLIEFLEGGSARLGFDAPYNVQILRDDARLKTRVKPPQESTE